MQSQQRLGVRARIRGNPVSQIIIVKEEGKSAHQRDGDEACGDAALVAREPAGWKRRAASDERRRPPVGHWNWSYAVQCAMRNVQQDPGFT